MSLREGPMLPDNIEIRGEANESGNPLNWSDLKFQGISPDNIDSIELCWCSGDFAQGEIVYGLKNGICLEFSHNEYIYVGLMDFSIEDKNRILFSGVTEISGKAEENKLLIWDNIVLDGENSGKIYGLNLSFRPNNPVKLRISGLSELDGDLVYINKMHVKITKRLGKSIDFEKWEVARSKIINGEK